MNIKPINIDSESKEQLVVFAARLKYLREQKGISQADLAYIIGVTSSQISKFETCKAFPRRKTLLKIVKLFDCSYDFLMSKSNYPDDEKYKEIVQDIIDKPNKIKLKDIELTQEDYDGIFENLKKAIVRVQNKK